MASVGSPPPGIKNPPANVSRRNAVTAASAGPNTIVRLPRRSFIVYPTADRSVTAASIADGCPVILRKMCIRDSVYAARNDLPVPEGAHFIADLIGLPVIDADTGREYGVLTDVFNAGASDIYCIATPDGERMMPAVPEFVISVDIESAIPVRPKGGMFD